MNHANYAAIDAINYSTLKEMRRSPAHYRHALTHPRKETPALRLGQAVHCAILEPERFAQSYVIWPAENGRRYGKKWDAFLEEYGDRSIISEDEQQTCLALAVAVRRDPLARALLAGGGRAEQVLTWTDDSTGVDCKGRVDFLRDIGGIVDLKTAQDASPVGFGRAAWRLGYHIQAAFYCDGFQSSHRGTAVPYHIIAVEKDAPHAVTVFRVTDDVLETGRAEYRALLARVAACRAADRWPAYAETEMALQLPVWAADQGEDEEGADVLDLVVGGEAL